MTILLTVLLVIVCFVLIAAILVQPGEGGDFMTAFSGGSTQVAFGSRGAITFWTKVVTGAAIMFLVLVLSLSIAQSRSGAYSVVPDSEPEVAETSEDSTAETEKKPEDDTENGETAAPEGTDQPAEDGSAEDTEATPEPTTNDGADTETADTGDPENAPEEPATEPEG